MDVENSALLSKAERPSEHLPYALATFLVISKKNKKAIWETAERLLCNIPSLGSPGSFVWTPSEVSEMHRAHAWVRKTLLGLS